MTKLRQVDKVSPNHVGEVCNSRRKDGFDSKAADFFLKISSGFDPKPWQLYVHHFVLKADKKYKYFINCTPNIILLIYSVHYMSLVS